MASCGGQWRLGIACSMAMLGLPPTAAAASGSSSLASSASSSFQFDGTTSDLAQQLYRRFLAGDEVDPIDIELPSSVSTRLSDAGVDSFASLPGLAQRALLWDSGFAITPDNVLKQIYPLGTRSMAELAVSLDDFTAAGCSPLECEQSDGATAYSNEFCTGDAMLTAAHCVVEDYTTGPDAGLAMWATGGSDSMIPEIRLKVHNWTDADGSYLLFAVHTLSEADEPPYGTCPAGGYGSVVIPCHPLSTYTDSSTSTLEEPQPTAWVTEWLQEFQTSSASSSTVDSSANSGSEEFQFDGTNSDIARQLYNRYLDGDTVPNITLNGGVPDRLETRLKKLGVTFEDLPGIVQRALLWDTGFALTPSNAAKEIWVLPDMIGDAAPSMASLAVSYQEFQDVSCEALNCSQPDGTKAFASLYCSGDQMLRGVKCAVDDFNDGGNFHLAMWANGGDTTTAVPEIRLVEHKWEDANTTFLVYAVHTMSQDSEPAYSECNADGYGSLVVPCYPLKSLTVAKNAGKVEPTQSTWVDDWVTDVLAANNTDGNGSDSGISLYVWVGIGGGALFLLVIGVGVGCFICRNQRKAVRDKLDSPTDNYGGDMNAGGGGGAWGDVRYGPGNHYQPYNHVATPQFNYDMDTGRPTATSGEDNASQRQGSPANRSSAALVASQPSYYVDDVESGGSNNGVTRMLRDDPVLGSKRLPFESIQFKRLLCKGAFGEVWVCDYAPAVGHAHEVAVKRLLQDRTHKFDEIQDFATEIQLTASLSHPNVVETLGVAWSSLDNLVLVMEFVALGDLQNYLKKHGDLLSWARDKIHMAIGIAKAIEYLHSVRPQLIHRDLKSKNVLLTRDLLPKIIDFGVTRRRVEETMTAGVGTPYWTAPEVLSGERYTEQSDIYSFGVLLSELDTCRLPYFDAVDAKGGKLPPFKVLSGVMSGVLRPSFSADCPTRVRRLGVACLQHDPQRRPSARDLVGVLGG